MSNRSLLISCFLFSALSLSAQVTDDFSDLDYTDSPVWTGDYASFFVNQYSQLQSKAQSAGFHYLSTPSDINQDAEWRLWCRIATSTSAYNNLRFYVLSSDSDPLQGDGWYIQVGGAHKNITLRQQTADDYRTVIENSERNGILSSDDNRVSLRLTFTGGVFTLSSLVEGVDSAFVTEGDFSAGCFYPCSSLALCVRCSQKTGQLFYFDSVSAHGAHSDCSDPASVDTTLRQPFVWTDMKSFSPDENGYNDLFLVHYVMPSSGYTALMRIYTADGLLIAETSQQAGENGDLVWNGKRSNGALAQCGVYVACCEFYNTVTGSRYEKKLTVALVY